MSFFETFQCKSGGQCVPCRSDACFRFKTDKFSPIPLDAVTDRRNGEIDFKCPYGVPDNATPSEARKLANERKSSSRNPVYVPVEEILPTDEERKKAICLPCEFFGKKSCSTCKNCREAPWRELVDCKKSMW